MSFLQEGQAYTENELCEESKSQERQRSLSRQFTVLIDVLYALVLVQGAEAYKSLFTRGDEFEHISWVLPVALALVLVYFTAIHSFIDFHLASEDQPYKFLEKKKRAFDLIRFYFDVVIVGAYSFVLLKCHVLLDAPGADLTAAFFAFPAIFALFIVWGVLRNHTDDSSQRYSYSLLTLFFGAYLVLALIYVMTSNGWLGNSEFLAVALALMIVYRVLNWQQNRTIVSA